MNKLLDQIAFGKKMDIIFQCLLFVLMVGVVKYTSVGLFGMYIMGAGQILSSIIWTIILGGGLPKTTAGMGIRVVLILTAIVLLATLVISPELFLGVSIWMIILGPILGVVYFATTITECHFYTKVRRPYYLL